MAREFVQNVRKSDIGTVFNIVGGEVGDEPVAFASREQGEPSARFEALKQAGMVAVFKTGPNFALVPVQG